MAAQAAFRVTPALLLLAAVLLLRRKMQSTPSTPPGVVTSNVTPEDRDAVVAAIAERGWPSEEVRAVIRIESAWRTDARNRATDASGLIQLMPAWFASHGFRTDLATGKERAAAFRQLGALQQLPWILTYFREVGRKWSVPGDTYMAVAAPAYVGAPNEKLIFAVGSKAWQQNPAWREPSGGPITAGSIRRVLLRQLGGSNRV